MFSSLFIFRGHSTREPAAIVFDEQGGLFYSAGPREPLLATANTGKTRQRYGENAGEWTGRVEISKEEIPGSS